MQVLLSPDFGSYPFQELLRKEVKCICKSSEMGNGHSSESSSAHKNKVGKETRQGNLIWS